MHQGGHHVWKMMNRERIDFDEVDDINLIYDLICHQVQVFCLSLAISSPYLCQYFDAAIQ